jgi:hypothetical protein
LQTGPGGAGCTVGVNDGPPDITAFSVGEAAGDVEVPTDGAVVVLDGASFSLVGLHAVNVLIAINAAPPAAIAIRRPSGAVIMVCPVCR